jgi:hypothetical protein
LAAGRSNPLIVTTTILGGLTVVLLGGMALGMHTSTPAAASHCGTALAGCGGGDTTRTSALVVVHKEDDDSQVLPVQPDTGETIGIEVVWSTVAGINCGCADSTASATAHVDWNSASNSWVATCTSGCDATNGPIYGVSVCDTGSCQRGGTTRAYAYKLLVDLADNLAFNCPLGGAPPKWLTRVDYTTTAVDNGNKLDLSTCTLGAAVSGLDSCIASSYSPDLSTCTLGAAVSPTSQTWSATDTGPFECAFNCQASGPQIDIRYQ